MNNIFAKKQKIKVKKLPLLKNIKCYTAEELSAVLRTQNIKIITENDDGTFFAGIVSDYIPYIFK